MFIIVIHEEKGIIYAHHNHNQKTTFETLGTTVYKNKKEDPIIIVAKITI